MVNRVRRARRVTTSLSDSTMSRGAQRKIDKKRRRAKVIRRKVIHLLDTCSDGILKEGILSQEDFDALYYIYNRITVSQVEDIDYWPVPKVINNNIRRYVHNHKEKVKISLWDKIIIRAIEEGAANISLEAQPGPFWYSAQTLQAIQTSLYESMLNQTDIPSSFL